jgi:hypothetical protein
MNLLDIRRARLRNERLTGRPFTNPVEVVRCMGAVQSQDYPAAKWGLAQRTKGATSAQIDRLFDAGHILRTHVLRPTWHFVAPEDLRWLLALTGPRVHAANSHYYRKVGLDAALFRKGHTAITRALEGRRHLTRDELAEVYRRAGIEASGMRLAYLLMHAELEGIVCSGPLRGKQFTYALVDERVPPAKAFRRDQALSELTRRYFASHGPAQVHDLAWWSGLTTKDVRAGIESVSELAQETIDGRTWHFLPARKAAVPPSPIVHLLPNYDEYLIAFKDHAASSDPAVARVLTREHEALQRHIVVLDGCVVGGWRSTVGKSEVTITTNVVVPLGRSQRAALDTVVARYARFGGVPARWRDATA